MSSQVFLWMNLIIAVFFVWLFFALRKNRSRPSRLNLKNSWKGFGLSKVTPGSPRARTNQGYQPKAKSSVDPINIRELNVVFMYNGHDWDAFQVLGIPAGSSVDSAEQAFIKEAAKANTETRQFLETALNAIKNKK